MSAPVDVLAVMDESVEGMRQFDVWDENLFGTADRLESAKSDIESLIKAAERAYAVLGVDDVNRRKSVQRDLRAALAGVGGAA